MKRRSPAMTLIALVVLCFAGIPTAKAEDGPKLIRLQTVAVRQPETSDSLIVEARHEDLSVTLYGLPSAPGPNLILRDLPLPGKGSEDPATVRQLLDLLNPETKPAAERGKGD